jgi:UDP-N-acetylglucosamine diphosphorylase/glucosamine-1-phosphate N-acetyltransferase
MKAVILAGGEGNRLRPLTHSRPKAMLPVSNLPLIHYAINALLKNGIRDITVVVGYRREHVIRYLNEIEIPVNIIVQENQLGPAHALKCAEAVIDEDFILLPGDNYIDTVSISKIKNLKYGLLVKDHPYPSNYGVIVIKDGMVRKIVEKPDFAPSFIVSTGIFTLPPAIFDYLKGAELPSALSGMIEKGDITIHPVHANQWHDAVYPWDLLKINERILDTIQSEKGGSYEKGAVITGPVKIGKGTTIGPNAVIQGPVIIGENCEIGPFSYLGPYSSIGPRAKIAPFTAVRNSILFGDVRIGSHSLCFDSIFGEGTVLADHSSTVSGIHRFEEEGKLIKGIFGAITGEQVSIAPHSVLKHCILGNGVKVEEGRTLQGFIPDCSVVK